MTSCREFESHSLRQILNTSQIVEEFEYLISFLIEESDMTPLILRLSQGGQAVSWIHWQYAVLSYAKDKVA